MDNETIKLFEKLVYKIAKKYSYNNEEFEDLYQVGNIGLINALSNYKKDSNTKFSTYAYFYIKGEILKYIRENRSIKVGNDIQALSRAINKVKEHLIQINMKEPTIVEIAEYLEVPIEEIEKALESNLKVKSLDYLLNEENDLYDYEAYEEKGYDIDSLAIKEEINKLSPLDRKLIISRYFEDKSQNETSKLLGISQVQVSRKENKILTKIKNNILNN